MKVKMMEGMMMMMTTNGMTNQAVFDFVDLKLSLTGINIGKCRISTLLYCMVSGFYSLSHCKLFV